MQKKWTMLGILICILGLTACSGIEPEYENNSITIHQDGSITECIREDFEEELYDTDDLLSSLDGEITEYNETAGENKITREKFVVAEDVACITLRYHSYEDFAAFNSLDFFVGSVEEAEKNGYKLTNLMDADQKQQASEDVLTDLADKKVCYIADHYDMIVEGKLLYYKEGMTIGKNNRVSAGELNSGYIIYE